MQNTGIQYILNRSCMNVVNAPTLSRLSSLSLHLSLRICLSPTFIITITFFIQNTTTTQPIHLPGGGQKVSCLGALVGCMGAQGLGDEKVNLTVGLIH